MNMNPLPPPDRQYPMPGALGLRAPQSMASGAVAAGMKPPMSPHIGAAKANPLAMAGPQPVAPQPQPAAVQAQAQTVNPLASAFQSFARGFAPQQTQAIDERHKVEATERLTKSLTWMQQTANLPPEQRAAFQLQRAQDIARETGQPYESVVATARDPNAFSDDAIKTGIAALSAQLGIAPEKPAGPDYQFLQGPDGAISRGDKTSGGLVPMQPGTPKPQDGPKAPTTTMDGTMQWNPQTGAWEDIPGAMDRWRQLNPPKPEGSGGTLTPYQQFQIDRQTQADAAKQEETSRQKQINIASLKDGMSRVDQFLGSKGFEGLYGTSWLGPVPTMGNAKPENVMNQDELNSMAMLNQIGGEAFLAGVAKMRGTGPLSDNEGKRVMAAVQRLTDRRQDKASAMAAANEFKAAMDALVKVYEQESGGAAMPGAVQTPQGQPNMLDAASQFIGNLFGGGQRQGGQQPVRVNSKAERDALPPGTSYVAPDGSVKVKK